MDTCLIQPGGWNTWAVPECSGQYRYVLGSTGMFWAVPVCSGQYRFVFETGMLLAVPVCSGQYRYDLDSTGMLWAVPVLDRAYPYYPWHTSSKSIQVLPTACRYCPQHAGTVQVFHLPDYHIYSLDHWFDLIWFWPSHVPFDLYCVKWLYCPKSRAKAQSVRVWTIFLVMTIDLEMLVCKVTYMYYYMYYHAKFRASISKNDWVMAILVIFGLIWIYVVWYVGIGLGLLPWKISSF